VTERIVNVLLTLDINNQIGGSTSPPAPKRPEFGNCLPDFDEVRSQQTLTLISGAIGKSNLQIRATNAFCFFGEQIKSAPNARAIKVIDAKKRQTEKMNQAGQDKRKQTARPTSPCFTESLRVTARIVLRFRHVAHAKPHFTRSE
jgi:hypothetical protein